MSTTSPRLLRVLTGAAILTAGLALSGCSAIVGALTGEDDVFSLKVGDCIESDELGDEIQTLPIVDCAEPHASEVYFSHLLADGDYPGGEAIDTEAAEVCLREYETFIGVAYEESVLDATYIFPTPESWTQGDREILCLALDPEGLVTGSLADAQR